MKLKEGTAKFYYNNSARSWLFSCSEFRFENSRSANIYLFKVSHRNTRKRCERCSKLTIKT